MLVLIAHVLVVFREPALGSSGDMFPTFDVSTGTGYPSTYSQLHDESTARTCIFFGHFRASFPDLRTSAIPHGHHITYQKWVENCTCSRLLSQAQKTTEHRSSDASINICSVAAFKLYTPTTTLMFVLPKASKSTFMCASLACAFDVFKTQELPYMSRDSKRAS